MPRHPLAFRRSLEEDPRRRPTPKDFRESCARRHEPPLDQFAVVGDDAELTLAFVKIQSYRIHGDWPSELVVAAFDRVFTCGAKHCHHELGVASRFIPTELERYTSTGHLPDLASFFSFHP